MEPRNRRLAKCSPLKLVDNTEVFMLVWETINLDSHRDKGNVKPRFQKVANIQNSNSKNCRLRLLPSPTAQEDQCRNILGAQS